MIEKIKIAGKEYPIAFTMLTIKRIKEQLGATNFEQLFEKVQELGNQTGMGTMDSVSEVLEPMGIIAHNGLWTGGQMAEKIYTNDINQTMNMISSFDEIVQCFTIFSNSFAAFFTGEKAEPETKKKGKVNP